MGIYSDVLLTVDFDRTLTAPDSTIPARNIEAIEYFMANGGVFTVNTGRSVPMYSSKIDLVPVNAPLLLYNGSAAYDREKREFTFATPIDLPMIETLRKTMELFPDCAVELQGQTAHYLFTPNEGWARYNEHNGCPYAFCELENAPGPFLKFTLYGRFRDVTVADLYNGTPAEFARFDEIERELAAVFGDKCVAFRAANRIIDVHAKGVSKAGSARRLQAELGRKILVCVGDGENDVTMMEDADYAFCPGDAIIRDRFENVCSCAEGAVADVIYKKIPEILG
ncbi:MAG: HAD hydrolase family protein [Oscillospiraceae bacterium]|nr:HAD hydrolase family protein [Oscillospiraceae bacterium]